MPNYGNYMMGGMNPFASMMGGGQNQMSPQAKAFLMGNNPTMAGNNMGQQINPQSPEQMMELANQQRMRSAGAQMAGQAGQEAGQGKPLTAMGDMIGGAALMGLGDYNQKALAQNELLKQNALQNNVQGPMQMQQQGWQGYLGNKFPNIFGG